MPRYLLLLREKPANFQSYGPEEMQKIIQEYSAWAEELDRQNRLEASQKLTDEGGREIRQGEDGKPLITDGPYSETGEIIGGFFIISADSYQEATELAGQCPHLKYGGVVHVRQIDELE